MIKIDLNYQIKEDIGFILTIEDIDVLELSLMTGISRNTLNKVLATGIAQNDTCEKFYSFIYKNKYRFNLVKEEFLKEINPLILFHGSKNGLQSIFFDGSKENADFGKGFYLGETFNQALSFVCENENSTVYSFKFDTTDLNICKLECNLDWMLIICYYRGYLSAYKDNIILIELIKKIENADVIIAPIADNKMFYIMSQFADGDINTEVAIHSLSASSLGNQYVIKSEKALKHLKSIEKYFLSKEERIESRNKILERSYAVETKLKLAKREFREGKYIEEVFK